MKYLPSFGFFLVLLSIAAPAFPQQKTQTPAIQSAQIRYQLWGTWPTVILLDTWTGKTWELRTVTKGGPPAWFSIEKGDSPEQELEIIERHKRLIRPE
jgi:hypothetical protein